MELIVKELKRRKLWLVSGLLKLKTPIIEPLQITIKSMEMSYQSQKEVKVVKGLKVKFTNIHPHTP